MLTNFLITCSGANREILDKCPLEKMKYVGIGLTNVLIAILSSVSVGFFVGFAFTNKQTGQLEIAWYALLAVCTIWGLIIFNLDRNIIMSIRKTGTKSEQFLQALPRLLIAIFIGIVISTPLELKIFSDEIKVQMEKNLKADVNAMKKGNAQTHSADLKKADSILKKEQEILGQKERRRNERYDAYIGEKNGTSGSRKRGRGPIFFEEEREYNNAISEYKKQDSIYGKAKSYRDSIQARISNTDKKDEAIVNDVNGPAAQVVALYQLPAVHWFVTILFILLETMPVIVKLMSKQGLYDEISERVETETRLSEEVILADKTSRRDHKLQEIYEINKLESDLRLTRERRRIAAEMKVAEEEDLPVTKTTETAPPTPGDHTEVTNEVPETAKPPEPAQEEQAPLAETQEEKATEPAPVDEQVPKNADVLGFENKTWKDENTEGVQYRFLRKDELKTLFQVKNGQEKNGNWEYYPDRRRLVMEMDGHHREFDIILETPTSLHLKSLMGKTLFLSAS